MEEILREYEVRLLDGDDRLVLVVPVIAGTEDDARKLATTLAAREKAAGFTLKAQMSSRRFRGVRPPAPLDEPIS